MPSDVLLPALLLLLLLISVSRVRVCVRDRVVCVHVPRVLLYRPTLYLTSSPTRVLRAHASGSGERCSVRSLRRMTRRRATRRDHAQCSIGLSWPDLCAKAAAHNGHAERTSLRSRMHGVECAARPHKSLRVQASSRLTICYATVAFRVHCRVSFVL